MTRTRARDYRDIEKADILNDCRLKFRHDGKAQMQINLVDSELQTYETLTIPRIDNMQLPRFVMANLASQSSRLLDCTQYDYKARAKWTFRSQVKEPHVVDNECLL